MEVPRLGFEWELSCYTTDTAWRDPNLVCDLYHSSWQRQILNPLSEAGDRTHVLMDPSQSLLSTMGTPMAQELPCAAGAATKKKKKKKSEGEGCDPLLRPLKGFQGREPSQTLSAMQKVFQVS